MIGGRGVVAGLDVGSTKTCAVILAPGEGGEDRLLGIGEAQTEGVRREEVTSLEATTSSLRESLREAELMAGHEVEGLYVGLAGSHIELGSSAGVVAIPGHEITATDVERVHEVGRAVALAPDRRLLHAIPQEYRVDGRARIQDPVGMGGTRLEADVRIVTAASSACGDLRKAVDRAGYHVEELVLEPLAGSLAVLREGERESGVALVEIGGETTEMIAFREGKLRLVTSLRWGGQTVTSDIEKGLGVPRGEAEALKREFGAALTGGVDPEERLEVSGSSAGSTRTLSRELLAHIIEQRLDEIFGLGYEALEEADLLDGAVRSVVLTGGGAALPGTSELAQKVFNLPVRIGAPGRGLEGLVEAIRKPRFATGVGLALYGIRRAEERRGGMAGRAFARVAEWFQEFF